METKSSFGASDGDEMTWIQLTSSQWIKCSFWILWMLDDYKWGLLKPTQQLRTWPDTCHVMSVSLCSECNYYSIQMEPFQIKHTQKNSCTDHILILYSIYVIGHAFVFKRIWWWGVLVRYVTVCLSLSPSLLIILSLCFFTSPPCPVLSLSFSLLWNSSCVPAVVLWHFIHITWCRSLDFPSLC